MATSAADNPYINKQEHPVNRATKIYIANTARGFGERRRLAGAIREYLAAGTVAGGPGRRYIGPRSLPLRVRFARAARLAVFSLLRERGAYLITIAAVMAIYATRG